eukprot:766625-Amphidinium_carterae.1
MDGEKVRHVFGDSAVVGHNNHNNSVMMRIGASGTSNAWVSQAMQMKAVSRWIPQPLQSIDLFVLAKQSGIPDQHGYEAWRRLCAQYEPTTSTRAVGMLPGLIAPNFSRDSLESWESQNPP